MNPKVLKCPWLRGEVKSKDGKQVIFCKVCKKDCSYSGWGSHCKNYFAENPPQRNYFRTLPRASASCLVPLLRASFSSLFFLPRALASCALFPPSSPALLLPPSFPFSPLLYNTVRPPARPPAMPNRKGVEFVFLLFHLKEAPEKDEKDKDCLAGKGTTENESNDVYNAARKH